MTSDDEVWFVLTFGGLFFGMALISVLGNVYLHFFQMQKIGGFLSRSRGMLVYSSSSRGGVFGSYLVLTCVGSFLVFPSWAIKSGSLSQEDYVDFPRGLLRVIRFFYMASLGSAMALIILLIGCKYMGWM